MEAEIRNLLEFGTKHLMDPTETQSFDSDRILYENNKPLKGTALTSKNIVMKRKNVPHLNSIKFDDKTTDITLVVDNQKINAHKDVLSSNSEYFDRMFTSSFKERDQDKIEINITDVSYETLKTLIEFFYSSKLTIKEQNVQDLLIGSNILLLEDVREACVDYLKIMIDVENCITMKDFADSLSLHDLYSLCLTFIINNFRLVANTEMFLTISYEEILSLIKDENLFAKEDMVYDVVMKWIKHDPQTRSKYSTELVWYVRLPLVLNTYQGVVKVFEFQGAKINDLSSFRTEHRKPFRKGILVLSHFPGNSSPEWFDASTDQWHHCICENCQCKSYKTILAPPRYLCTCALLDDGRMLAVGGFVCGRESKLARVFDPKTSQWTTLPEMMYGRIKPYVVQLGSQIYVIGGHGTRKCIHAVHASMSNMEYYDLKKGYWLPIQYTVKGFSIMRNDTFVASVNGLIYIIGMDKAGFFNPSKNLWCSIPLLPEKREDAAVCALHNSIYVIGGHKNGKTLKSVWAYCTETKVWVLLADMNSPRSHLGAVVMNGFIYVFGGKSENKTFLNTLEVYNPHANEWTTSNALMNNNGDGRCNIDAIVVEKSSMLFKRVFEDSTINIIH